MPPAKPATLAPWPGGVFFRYREIYPDGSQKWWLSNRRLAGAASSDRLPIHRSESPTGYSSAGCSPAEPASASPVTDNRSSIPIRRANQIALLNLTAGMHAHSRSSCPRQPGVSSLLCTPGDISILRRHRGADPASSICKIRLSCSTTGPTSNWKALAIAVLLRLGDFPNQSPLFQSTGNERAGQRLDARTSRRRGGAL
jgi:hypothetical protein